MAKYFYAIVVLIFPCVLFASEPAGPFERHPDPAVEQKIFDSLDIQTPTAVSNTIEFLLCGQDSRHWLCGVQNERRDEVSESIVALARIHKIPPFLLVVKFYLESRFDIHKIGKLGEVGIPQVHGIAKRGCELDSAHGQMECGAVYLELLVDACKSKTLQSALLVYMSGKCRPSKKVWAIADYRLGLYFRLVKRAEKLFQEGVLPILEPLIEKEQELIIVSDESEPEKSDDSLQEVSQEYVSKAKAKPKIDILSIVAAARERVMKDQ